MKTPSSAQISQLSSSAGLNAVMATATDRWLSLALAQVVLRYGAQAFGATGLVLVLLFLKLGLQKRSPR